MIEQIQIPDFKNYSDEGTKFLADTKSYKCQDESELKQCLEIFAYIKARKKEIQVDLDRDLEPKIKLLHEMHRQATGLRKQILQPWNDAEVFIEGVMRPYALQKKQAEEKERLRLQAEADKKAEEEKYLAQLEAELDGSAEEAAVIESLAPVAEQVRARPVTPVVTGASARFPWKWRIVDVNKVPREYLCIDYQAINARFKLEKEAMKIPGIETYQDVSFAG